MVIDQPMITYNNKKGNKRTLIATQAEADELDELTKMWQESRKGDSLVGKKVDLGDFLKQKF